MGWFQISKLASLKPFIFKTNLGFFHKPHNCSRTNDGFSQLGLKQNHNPQNFKTNAGFSQLGKKHSFSRSNLGFSQSGIKHNQKPQFSRTSSVLYHLGISKKLQNPQNFTTGARRSYYVDSNKIQHFRPRGPNRWFQNPRKVLAIVLIGLSLTITIYAYNLETIPYTKRKHFVLLSKSQERKLGETYFRQIKRAYKKKILPKDHPESVRVRHIAKEVIGALKRGLNHEKELTDMRYGVERENGASESREGYWHKENEVLDDRLVRENREIKGTKPSTSHLDDLKWEVVVVDDSEINAFCLPGGKIMFFTGLLKHFSDLEVATVMGHEVGHIVARHGNEGITKNLGYALVQWILYQVTIPDVADTMSNLFLRLPFSRRMEMEADYIGLLLMASAGYNPRLAPAVYEKLEKITGTMALQDYLSTHPSGKKRAKLLSRAQVMEEAMGIYQKVLEGKGTEGFL